jgi:hypothetical protein
VTKSDRAANLATAILQIVKSTDDPALQRVRLEQYLRDEIADIERQITSDREAPDA